MQSEEVVGKREECLNNYRKQSVQAGELDLKLVSSPAQENLKINQTPRQVRART